MKTAILIPHYHKDERSTWLLYNLLDSIERHEPDLLRATVICDDASPIPDLELRRILSPYPVALLRKQKNTGYSKNVNMGLQFLKGKDVEYAFILNNDLTLVQPITPLLAYFKQIEGLSVVGPRLWFPDGRLQHGGISVDSAKTIEHPNYGTWDTGRGTRFVHAVTGAMQLVDVARVNPYPEEYTLGYEDVAFCLREWECGRRVLFSSELCAVHSESITRGYQVGEREWHSLTEFRRATFRFPEVESHLAQAQADYPHERLKKILSPQPLPLYVRDSRRKDAPPRGANQIRTGSWALTRKRRKLAPVGPSSKGSRSPKE